MADEEGPARLGVPLLVFVAAAALLGEFLVGGVVTSHVRSPPGRTPLGWAVFGFADLLFV